MGRERGVTMLDRRANPVYDSINRSLASIVRGIKRVRVDRHYPLFLVTDSHSQQHPCSTTSGIPVLTCILWLDKGWVGRAPRTRSTSTGGGGRINILVPGNYLRVCAGDTIRLGGRLESSRLLLCSRVCH